MVSGQPPKYSESITRGDAMTHFRSDTRARGVRNAAAVCLWVCRRKIPLANRSHRKVSQTPGESVRNPQRQLSLGPKPAAHRFAPVTGSQRLTNRIPKMPISEKTRQAMNKLTPAQQEQVKRMVAERQTLDKLKQLASSSKAKPSKT